MELKEKRTRGGYWPWRWKEQKRRCREKLVS
jgi:hypothetical protein